MINVLYDEHQRMLEKLLEKGVDFILVGGYAVIAHGYEHTHDGRYGHLGTAG